VNAGKAKVGDMVKFSGNYVIESSGISRIMLDTIERTGIIIHKDDKHIKVFSLNETCVLPIKNNGAVIMYVVSNAE